MRGAGSSQRKLGHCTHRRAGEIASEKGVIGSNARGAVTPRRAVLGDAGTVSLALSTHLPSPGGDPDQYEEEQSGKHIAGVYIFEAGSAGWTAIEDLPVSAIANRSPCHVGRISHMRWLCAKRAWFLS